MGLTPNWIQEDFTTVHPDEALEALAAIRPAQGKVIIWSTADRGLTYRIDANKFRKQEEHMPTEPAVQMTIRLPRAVRERLEEEAERQQRSLTYLVVQSLLTTLAPEKGKPK